MQDRRERDPAKRYKMLFSCQPDGTPQSWMTRAAFSPDGIHWTAGPDLPIIPFSDTQSCPFWDAHKACGVLEEESRLPPAARPSPALAVSPGKRKIVLVHATDQAPLLPAVVRLIGDDGVQNRGPTDAESGEPCSFNKNPLNMPSILS